MAPFLAPLLKGLAVNGLGLIGEAILAKGKDFVERELGVDIESSLGTEEGRLRLMELQFGNEERLRQFTLAQRTQELQSEELGLKDTDSARTMNARIQEAIGASRMAKNAPYVLDFLVVGSAVLLTLLTMLKAIPEENAQVANIALGSLWTMAAVVLQFHRGSSAGSKMKDAERRLLQGDKQ